MIDDTRKIGIVPIGDRPRVAGTAEFAGHGLIVYRPQYPQSQKGDSWPGPSCFDRLNMRT